MHLHALPPELWMLVLKYHVAGEMFHEARRLSLVCSKSYLNSNLRSLTWEILELWSNVIPDLIFQTHYNKWIFNRENHPMYLNEPDPKFVRHLLVARFLLFKVKFHKRDIPEEVHFVKTVRLVATEITAKFDITYTHLSPPYEKPRYDHHYIWSELCRLASTRTRIWTLKLLTKGPKRRFSPFEERICDTENNSESVQQEARRSLLTAAAFLGDFPIVEHLLRHGADANQGTRYFGKPIHAAVEAGHIKIIQTLIAAGSQINCSFLDPHTQSVHSIARPSRSGYDTPLELACSAGDRLIIDIILTATNNGSSLSRIAVRSAIMRAAEGNYIDIILRLVKLPLWTDINRQAIMQDILIPAVAAGQSGLVKKLISMGVEPEWKNSVCNESPVVLAARYGYGDIIEILAEAGASVNGRSAKQPHRALVIAAERGHAGAVDSLIKAGAVIGYGKYSTALEHAVIKNRVAAARVLLENGAHSCRPERGSCLLARPGKESCLRVLLMRGTRTRQTRSMFRLLLHAAFVSQPLKNQRKSGVFRAVRKSGDHPPYWNLMRQSCCDHSEDLQLERDTNNRGDMLKMYSSDSVDRIYSTLLGSTCRAL